jgi:ADP-heptose:LPS heptosyltransferase
METFSTDCKHYTGTKPCAHNRLCDGCPHYENFGKQILIIKTAALGDVLRTTSLPPALAREMPGAKISWLTSPDAVPLLIGNPDIAEIIPFDETAWPSLAPRKFDMLICLDKEAGPAGMAALLGAERKLGIGLSAFGTPYPLNPEAEHYFALGLSDKLKFEENKTSYHQLIAEAAGLEYKGERPFLALTEIEKEYGLETLKRAGWYGSRPVLGINTGAGGSFANKMLSAVAILEVIDAVAAAAPDAFIALLGGPMEKEKNSYIARAAAGKAHDTLCNHSIRGFAGIVSHCGVMLAGDTLAMHIAIALGTKVVALFGPTVEQEIDLFGNGVKISTGADCAPCYKRECIKSANCMESLHIGDIASAISGFFQTI